MVESRSSLPFAGASEAPEDHSDDTLKPELTWTNAMD